MTEYEMNKLIDKMQDVFKVTTYSRNFNRGKFPLSWFFGFSDTSDLNKQCIYNILKDNTPESVCLIVSFDGVPYSPERIGQVLRRDFIIGQCPEDEDVLNMKPIYRATDGASLSKGLGMCSMKGLNNIRVVEIKYSEFLFNK